MQAAPCGSEMRLCRSAARRVVSSLVLPLPGGAKTTHGLGDVKAAHCWGLLRMSWTADERALTAEPDSQRRPERKTECRAQARHQRASAQSAPCGISPS